MDILPFLDQAMGTREVVIDPNTVRDCCLYLACSSTITQLRAQLEDKLGIYRKRFTIRRQGRPAPEDFNVKTIDPQELEVVVSKGKERTVTYVVEGTSRTRTIKFLPKNTVDELKDLIADS